MDTAKAIQLLHRISDSQFDGEHGDERREALEMAVRALEPNLGQKTIDCIIKRLNDEERITGDTISRKMAIDKMKEHRSIFCDNTPETFSGLPYGDKCRVDEIDNAIATLVNLPSAQFATDTNVGGTVSRQAAIDALAEELYHNEEDYRTAVKAIGGLPSAQPETHDKRTETHECDLIGRQEAIDAVAKWFHDDVFGITESDGTATIFKRLRDLPSARTERKKGKWIDKSNGIEGAWNYCSVCGEQAIDLYDFCPNCGADMRGEEHD